MRARSFLRHWLANSCCRHNQLGIDPRLDRLGSGPVIVVQHAAQVLPALDLSRASEVAGFWADVWVPVNSDLADTVGVEHFPSILPHGRVIGVVFP